MLQNRMRFRKRHPVRRITKIGEQLLEERLETVELTQLLEAAANQAIPPFALETADLFGAESRTESQPRRSGECAMKPSAHISIGGGETVLPRDPRISMADWLASIEQGTSRIEEDCLQHDDVSLESDRIPHLDERAESRLGRDIEFALAAPVLVLVDHTNAIGLELTEGLVEILEVDGHVMEPFAIFRDELANKIGFAAGAGTLDELELESRDIEVAQDKALGGRMRLAAHGGGKVAQEKIVSL